MGGRVRWTLVVNTCERQTDGVCDPAASKASISGFQTRFSVCEYLVSTRPLSLKLGHGAIEQIDPLQYTESALNSPESRLSHSTSLGTGNLHIVFGNMLPSVSPWTEVKNCISTDPSSEDPTSTRLSGFG